MPGDKHSLPSGPGGETYRNRAGNVGGGIRMLGNATVVNSTISGNTSTAWYGGAVFHTDGVMSVVKLLELLLRSSTTLGRVIDEIPPVHVVRADVATPWGGGRGFMVPSARASTSEKPLLTLSLLLRLRS